MSLKRFKIGDLVRAKYDGRMGVITEKSQCLDDAFYVFFENLPPLRSIQFVRDYDIERVDDVDRKKKD